MRIQASASVLSNANHSPMIAEFEAIVVRFWVLPFEQHLQINYV